MTEKNWRELFELPNNNMRARVVWRLHQRGMSLVEIGDAMGGLLSPNVAQLRKMYMERANDWRDRVPGAEKPKRGKR